MSVPEHWLLVGWKPQGLIFPAVVPIKIGYLMWSSWHVPGITFNRHAQSQKITKLNSVKVFCRKQESKGASTEQQKQRGLNGTAKTKASTEQPKHALLNLSFTCVY
jgi:hypothetical protein